MIARAEAVVCVPEVISRPRIKAERLTVILIAIGTFFYLLAFRRVVNMDPDEGIVLQGAERILHGQIPYRDFFTFYTPGSFYLTAAVLRIFGDSLTVARTVLVVFGTVLTPITYMLARRRCSRRIAVLIAVMVASTTLPYRFLVLHNWDSTFWTCLSVYCAVRWLESTHGLFAFATGTLASFTFLSEQSKGVGLGLGILGAILILASSGRKLRGIGLLALGLMWPVFFTAVYFASKRALRPMLRDLLWPLLHYSAANRVRYGDQNWSDHAREVLFHSGPLALRIVKAIAVSSGFVVPVLPIIATLLLFYWIFRLRHDETNHSAYYVLLCSVLSGLMLSVLIVRADIIHFMYLTPLFYLVLAWIVDCRDLPRGICKVSPYAAVYATLAFGLMALALFVSAVGARNRIETRRGTVFARDPDTIVPELIAQTWPGEKILVYPYLPLYYYLSATQSPSPYEYFQPGMSTDQQAKEVLESIRSGDIRTVLFEPAFADKVPNSWPGTPISAMARDIIADYIVRNYKVCKPLKSAANWNFLLLRQRDDTCR